MVHRQPEYRWDFHLRFADADRYWAGWVSAQLRRAGYRVNHGPDEERQAARTLVILSPAALGGGGSRRAVPVRVEECRPAVADYLDLVGLAEPEARRRLLDGAAAAVHAPPLADPGPGTAPPPPPPPSTVERVVPRTHLLNIIRGLLLDRRAPLVGLVGMLGAGTSTMARTVADDPALRTRFPEVAWVPVGPAADPTAAQAVLSAALGDARPVDDPRSGLDRLRALIRDRPHLVVLDGVTRREQLAAFDLDDPACALLVTARDAGALGGAGEVCPVDLLDPAQGRLVLAAWAGRDPEGLPPEANELLNICGGLALPLAVAGGLVAAGPSWNAVVQRVRGVALPRLRARFPGHPRPHLLAACEAGVAALDTTLRDRYLRLAVFAGRGAVPVGAAELLWGPPLPHQPSTVDVIATLAGRALLRHQDGHFTLHELLEDYLGHVVGPARLPKLHQALATAILQRWGGLELDLPLTAGVDLGTDPTDRYGLAHLVDHLVAGGLTEPVHRLLTLEGSLFTATGRSPDRVNLWYGVQERIGQTGAYRRDVDTARRLAEQVTDAAGTDGATPAIGLELRYALMYGSAVSVAGGIPADLLPALVEHGVWSPAQALAYARSVPSRGDRVSALEAVLPALPEDGREATVAEAAAAARGGTVFTQADVLYQLHDQLTGAQQGQLLADSLAQARAVPTTGGARSHMLLTVAKLAPPELREQILGEALTAAREPNLFGARVVEAEAKVLTSMATYAQGYQRDRLLAYAVKVARAIEDARARCGTLVDVARLQDGRDRSRTLELAALAARQETSPYWRADALLKIGLASDEPRRDELVAEAFAVARTTTGNRGLSALSDVVPYLPDRLLPEARVAAREVADPVARGDLLRRLARRVPAGERDAVLAEALAAARGVSTDRGQRARQLTWIALQVPPERRLAVVTEALAAARAVGDRGELAAAYASLAAWLPEPQRSEVFDDALALVHAIPSHRRLWTLIRVAEHIPPPESEALFGEVLDLVAADDTTLSALAEVTPHLPRALAERAMRIAVNAPTERRNADIDPTLRAQALAYLAEYLPEPALEEVARAAVTEIRPDKVLAPLRRLAPRLSPDALAATVQEAANAHNEYGLAPILAVLAPYLPPDVRTQVLANLYEFGQTVSAPRRRCELMTLLAPNLDPEQRPAALSDARTNADLITDPGDRARALTALAAEVPPDQRAATLSDALAAAGTADSTTGVSHRMGTVARAASEQVTPEWTVFWRPVLRQAAIEGRAAVADQIEALSAYLPRLGEPRVAASVVAALNDVIRWWP